MQERQEDYDYLFKIVLIGITLNIFFFLNKFHNFYSKKKGIQE